MVLDAATSLASFRNALKYQIKTGLLSPTQAAQVLSIYATSGPVRGALAKWSHLVELLATGHSDFSGARAAFAAFLRGPRAPAPEGGPSMSHLDEFAHMVPGSQALFSPQLSMDIKHDIVVSHGGPARQKVRGVAQQATDDVLAMCGVEKFIYPAFVADWEGKAFSVNLNEKKPGMVSAGKWRAGLVFDSEAEFMKAGRLQCGCCEFRQEFMAMSALRVLPDEKARLSKATPRVQKALDERFAVDKLRPDNMVFAHDLDRWIQTADAGDRTRRVTHTPGSDIARLSTDTYLAADPSTWAIFEDSIKGAIREELVDGMRSHKDHPLGGVDIATRKGGRARRVKDDFRRKWTQLGRASLRRRGCHYYAYDAPETWAVQGEELFALFYFVGVIKPVRGPIGGDIMCSGAVRGKFGVPRIKSFGFWLRVNWPWWGARGTSIVHEPFVHYDLWIPEKECQKKLSARSDRRTVAEVPDLFAGEVPKALANTQVVRLRKDGELRSMSGRDALDHISKSVAAAASAGEWNRVLGEINRSR